MQCKTVIGTVDVISTTAIFSVANATRQARCIGNTRVSLGATAVLALGRPWTVGIGYAFTAGAIVLATACLAGIHG